MKCIIIASLSEFFLFYNKIAKKATDIICIHNGTMAILEHQSIANY